MNLIKTWLNGNRNYDVGVKLYLQFGDSPIHKKLFTTEGQTPFKKKRLEELLSAIVARQDKAPEQSSQIPISDTEVIKAWPADAVKDDVERSLRTTWLEKFKEMQDLRSQLLLLPNDDQRCQSAFTIIRLDRDCDQVYFERDYYLKEGKLPHQSTTTYIQDPLLMGVRITSLQRYIRREGVKIKAGDGIPPANIVARRQEFIQELNYYLEKLGKPLFTDNLLTGETTR